MNEAMPSLEDLVLVQANMIKDLEKLQEVLRKLIAIHVGTCKGDILDKRSRFEALLDSIKTCGHFGTMEYIGIEDHRTLLELEKQKWKKEVAQRLRSWMEDSEEYDYDELREYIDELEEGGGDE